MTKKLEELFNLATNDEPIPEESKKIVDETKLTIAAVEQEFSNVQKIEKSLPFIRDLDTTDKEMDELAQRATEVFDDMVELAMNVEARFSGRIFETAAQMLGHAIAAKNAKIDKKLKIIDLQLKKAKLDQTAKKSGIEEPEEGEGTILKRSDLLKSILDAHEKNQEKK